MMRYIPSNCARRRTDGFSLVETIVVAAIISVLAAAATLSLDSRVNDSRETACKAEYSTLRRAVDAYKISENDWPPDVGSLVTDGFILTHTGWYSVDSTSGSLVAVEGGGCDGYAFAPLSGSN